LEKQLKKTIDSQIERKKAKALNILIDFTKIKKF